MGPGRGTHGNSWLCVTQPITLGCKEGPCCPWGFQCPRTRGTHAQLGQGSFPELQDVGAEGNSSLDPQQEGTQQVKRAAKGSQRVKEEKLGDEGSENLP